MYQTWPPVDRPNQFQGSIESYELAAADIGGEVFPVARAWLAVWERDPAIALSSDGLHASVAGSYLAALVMYAGIFDRTPVGLPATVRTRGVAVVRVDPALTRTLQEAAASVTTTASSR